MYGVAHSSTARPRRRAAPLPLQLLLAGALAAQLAWHALQPSGANAGQGAQAAQPLPPPMPLAALRLASLGEPLALSKLLMLQLQSFDDQPGQRLSWRELDYGRLAGWLERALDLDPRGQYPLLAASQVYSAVNDAARSRRMLDLVYREFMRDPQRRWPWLAHAALVARHRLHDLPLARRYASAIRTQATRAPAWARELEVFVLEDMNELDSARKLIGALLSSGQITDPGEARFLAARLEALQRRASGPGVDRPAAGLVR
ncbi:hypothetical protein [Pseudoduganella violacea]|uniref:Tetratricopeptide repeat protein n=1 Tax=Pseudoduganella violacea TaxID=1715466 RepID=A0A7W5FVP2_9BURK|nr:hypothetical protein [Pseudoduganella violacea]MBB3121220.1 hypothetical protein [Pseudoduganella violacea]